MTTHGRLQKSLAAGLSALIIALSPGLGCYHAVAANVAGPTGASGLPSGGLWAPRLQSIMAPRKIAGFSGMMRSGVDVAALLKDLASVDLRSAAGRSEAAPVFERLIAAQARSQELLDDSQIVDIMAAVAFEQRTAAALVALKIEHGAGLDDKDEINAALRALNAHKSLLGRDARTLLAQQTQKFNKRVFEQASVRAKAAVEKGTASWHKREATDVKGTDSSGKGRLLKFSRAEAPETRETPAARAPAVVLPAAVARPSLLVAALPIVAAIAAALLIPAVPAALALTAGVIGSILLHETAHLYMLRKLGDTTAADHGVTSLNPLKLIHPVGTVLVPLVSAVVSHALLGVPVVLGWARPIPVDFNKLADPKRDAMKVALAGPLMNAVLALTALGVLAVLSPLHALSAASAGLVLAFAKMNAALAVFNMLPLPQLDGGKVLVGLLPQRLYDKWTANKRLPEAYQSTFRKLYEGPSTLLNFLGMDGQGRVNAATRLITLGVFAAFAAAAWSWLGVPVLLLLLVCSYDYYCIREKIQNEEATRSIMGIMQGLGAALAREAENDDSVQSVVNTEEVEHILKNALEDTIDQVVDSEGFEDLSPEEKASRLEAAYMDAAVAALKSKGMSADDPDTIRRLLKKVDLWGLVRGWVEKYDVWTKWHSPKRKTKKGGDQSKKKSGFGTGGATMLVLLGIAGAALAGASGPAMAATAGLTFLAGTLQQTPRKRQPAFAEALNDPNLKLTDKEKAFLLRLLKEMKQEKKPPMTGRVKELEQLLKAITSPRGVINSAVFVGKKGVGKTSVVEMLAQLLAQSDVRDLGTFTLKKLDGRYLVKLNVGRLLQMDDPSAALDALLEVLARFNSEDKRSGNKVILFVDEIHQIFLHPKGAQMANMLKEPLRDGELTLIAATTDAEYKKFMEEDEAFRDRLIPIWLDEATVPETIRALENAKGYYEDLFGVRFTPEALKAAAEMSKFDQEVHLPRRAFNYVNAAGSSANFDTRRDALSMRITDKAGELRYTMGRLSDELAKTDRLTQNVKEDEPTTIELYNVAVRLTKELVALYRKRAAVPSEGVPVVDEDLVKEEIALKTGVASGQLTLGQEPIEKYLEMEKIVGGRVIGQDEAIATIARSVRQNKAGLSDPKRPMGVFYLTGPTGSGKTHLAKELARFLFNDPDAMIRVDMTEYQESHAKSRMIGSPPGYVGFESGGQLTEAVRKKPYSVILLDEIEKAHPDVFLLLLQIMGEGRLTDGKGRLVDFKNTMILMASNLGMFAVDVEKYAKTFAVLQDQKRAAEQSEDAATVKMLDAQMRALAVELADVSKRRAAEITEQAFKETYPPEFQGRLHAPPIVFNRLTPEDAVKVAELNLRDLRNVLGFAGHAIEWTPEVAALIVNEGYSVALGARPLQNAIDRLITQPISTEILKNAVATGRKIEPSRIAVSIEKGRIKIGVSVLEKTAPAKLTPGEGAARDVFASVMQASAASAANTAALPGTDMIDAWVRLALNAYQEEPETEGVQSETRPPEPAPTGSPNELSGSSLFFANTELAMTSPQTVTASHYENERKDPKIKAAAEDLKAAMTANGYGESQREALLRSIPGDADPYVGWLKLFVEQAKKMTPADERGAPVAVSFEAGETLKIAVTRPGALGEAERKVLKNHFTGPVPPSAEAGREKAETMNAFMNEDGRRLLFDLYRKLSGIPGARLGWAQTAQGVQYWLELPKPPAPEQDRPHAESASAAERPLPPTALEDVESAALDASKAGFGDPAFTSAHEQLLAGMQAGGYSREARTLASSYAQAAAAELKALGDTEGLTFARAMDGGGVRLVFTRERPFSLEDIARLNRVLQPLEAAIRETGAEQYLQPGSGRLILELPAPSAAQADGQARSPEAAATPAASEARARLLAKLQTGPSGSPEAGWLWASFETVNVDATIKPLLRSLGLKFREAGRSGRFARMAVRFESAAHGAEIALRLAEQSIVRLVTVSAPVLAAARSLPEPTAPLTTRAIAHDLALHILRQGDTRSTSVRVAAADLMGAASTAADLALARDWIRYDSSINAHWPQLAAAALVIARHGSRADDEARLIRAMGYLAFGGYGSDLYKPAKRRLVESLAKLLATDNPARLAELARRLEAEKGKPGWNTYSSDRLQEDQFAGRKNELLVEALYLALTKHGGAESRALIVDGWEQRRIPQIFEYFKRVDPAHLAGLLERWRRGGPRPDGLDKYLTLYAVGELGERSDAPSLYNDAATGWNGALDNQTTPMAAAAAARLVERTGAWDLVQDLARRALRERMGDGGTFSRLITAVQVVSRSGDEADLARLEELLRSNPEDVNYVHEMTQHEAANAWARLVTRLQLFDRLLPRIQAMLADTNPIVNEAAMEALRLRLKAPRAPAPPAPVGGPAPAGPAPAGPAGPGPAASARGFFAEGPLRFPLDSGWSTYYFPEDASLAAQRPELELMSYAQRTDAAEWAERFARIMSELLGQPFTPEVRFAQADGRLTLVWVLRQAATAAVDASKLPNVGQLVNLLIYIRAQAESSRAAQLRRLAELGYQDPSGLYELLGRLEADAAVSMGLGHDPSLGHTPGRAETELWLKYDLPLPSRRRADDRDRDPHWSL